MKPKLLILGHARHGKDTVAEMLRDRHGFSFASSSYFAMQKVIRPALAEIGINYTSDEECYADRVNHRGFWYDKICEYNGGGPSRLAEEILVDHDMYVGMRANDEYVASRPMFDFVVWVDSSGRGIPPEDSSSMTIEYDPQRMVLINNGGTLEDLAAAIDDLIDMLAGY